MKKNNILKIMGFVLMAVLFFVVLAACDGEVNLDETYSSDYYQIDYNSDWEVDPQTQFAMLDTVSFLIDSEGDMTGVSIIVESEVHISPEEYMNEEQISELFHDFEMIESRETKLDEQPAYQIIFTASAIEGQQIISLQRVAVKDGVGYVFNFFALEEEFDQYMPYVEEMMDSFSFK